MRIKYGAFWAMLVAMLVMGAWLGFSLSEFEKLVPFKLLNILGITYNLLGVVVLAEFVIKNQRLTEFMVNRVAPTILWGHTIIPIGGLIGVGLGYSLPAAGLTAKILISFFFYSLLPLSAFESAVVNVQIKALNSINTRTHSFGLFLLLSGCALQLIAAIKDFIA